MNQGERDELGRTKTDRLFEETAKKADEENPTPMGVFPYAPMPREPRRSKWVTAGSVLGTVARLIFKHT